MAKKTPTATAKGFYESIGFRWGKCDQKLPIPGKHITVDLFNAFDAIAVKPDIGIVGVQVTSRSNHAARRTKLKGNPDVRMWLAAGGRVEIASTKGADVKREELTLDDLPMA